MDALHRPEPVFCDVASLSFGYYTPSQARALSVKRVTATEILDIMDNAVPDGLYDPALGPTDPKGSCVTCRLGYALCPGHFGHIELPLVCYNPLAFPTVLKLLRAQCLSCFRFRSLPQRTAAHARKLRLLAAGRLVEASRVQLSFPKPPAGCAGQAAAGRAGAAAGDGSDDVDMADGGDDDGHEATAAAAAAGDGGDSGAETEAAGGGGGGVGGGASSSSRAPGPGAWTSHGWGESRSLIGSFLRGAPRKCACCGAVSPTLRAEPPLRITRLALKPREAGRNAALNVDVEADLGRLWAGIAAETGALAGAQPPEAAAAAAEEEDGGGDGAAGDAAAGKTDDDDDDDDDDGGDEGGEAEAEAEAEEAAAGGDDDVEGEAEGDGGGAAAVAGARRRPAPPPPPAAGAAVLVTPAEAHALLGRLWAAERAWVGLAYPADAAVLAAEIAGGPAVGAAAAAAAAAAPCPDASSLFLRTLLVPPSRLRPPSRRGDGDSFEHPQNVQYRAILTAATRLADLFDRGAAAAAEDAPAPPQPAGSGRAAGGGAAAAAAAARAAAYAAASAAELATPAGRAARAVRLWTEMQAGVNALFGCGGPPAAPGAAPPGPGLRQLLERKQGLFRMNMMGKRVNFAARSVISPDPYLAPGEVGIPPYIATKLTFPEAVTPYNVAALRAAVCRGPEGYPGATAVETEGGRVVLLASLGPARREALARTLLTGTAAPAGGGDGGVGGLGGGGGGAGGGGGGGCGALADGCGPYAGWGAKTVHRHLVDGDLLLTNRQPTLHRPGLLAHRARVLPNQRTIRLHYANCAAFNADFDGDEVNLHLPQNLAGVAEAALLAHADGHYCVPTDGKPLRGLIQDHVCAGVLMTSRDCFLPKARFTALLLAAAVGLGLAPRGGGAAALAARPARGLCTPLDAPRGGSGGSGQPARPFPCPLPAPALLKPLPLWTGKQLLGCVLGLLAAGRPGLTCVARGKLPDDYWGATSGEDSLELFRGTVVRGVLDKAAFTKHGLVHAVAEVYGPADAGRLLAALSRALTLFLADTGLTCGLDDMALTPSAEAARAAGLGRADGVSRGAAHAFASAGAADPGPTPGEGDVRAALVARLRERAGAEAGLDAATTGPLNKITSAVIKAALPAGQVKPFPRNGLSLMTASGAKGGAVNFAQISALLGQQELEGRRVPRLPSGKTLPCFSAWDTSARAGGYIADRFLTGIRPQEYYFHCMAGREGLVDTAVKTSRSGYLQRCLVKCLEPLVVAYDGTVRSGCDGGVVQFAYGEDGMEVGRCGYARAHGFVAANAAALAAPHQAPRPRPSAGGAAAGTGGGSGGGGATKAPLPFLGRALGAPPPPLPPRPPPFGPPGLPPPARWHAAAVAGVLPEAFEADVEAYIAADPDGLLRGAAAGGLCAASLRRLCALRFRSMAAAPGEAVGVLAAQSVGEPSTQMTLNTFHFAGRGEANVTLGIPRLRELLMAAAVRIGTPVMTLPVAGAGAGAGAGERAARALASALRRVTLAELVDTMSLQEAAAEPGAHGAASGPARTLTLTITVRCADGGGAGGGGAAAGGGDVTFGEVAAAFEAAFVKQWFALVRAELRRAAGADAGAVTSVRLGAAAARRGGDGGGGGGGDGDGGGDGGDGGDGDGGGGGGGGGAGTGGGDDDEGEVGEPPGGGGGGDDDDDDDDDDDEGTDAKAAGRRAERAGGGEGYTERGRDDGDDDDVGGGAGGPAGGRPLPDDTEEEAEQGAARARRGGGAGGDDDEAGGSGGDDGDGGGGGAARAGGRAGARGRGRGRGGGRGGRRPAPSGGGAAPRRRAVAAAAAGDRPTPGLVSTLSDAQASCAFDPPARRLRATLVLSAGAPKLLGLSLAEAAAARSLVRSTPGLGRVYVLPPDPKAASASPASSWRVQTDGVSFAAAAEQPLVDHARASSNDVAAVLRRYGVEAARAVLLAEVRAVFGAYGIAVDPRHLSLVADAMTHGGAYAPCSRAGVEAAPAPLLKASFETAATFLADAALRGATDTLGTPAARIVLGRMVGVGTGAFGLQFDAKKADRLHAAQLRRAV